MLSVGVPSGWLVGRFLYISLTKMLFTIEIALSI